MSIRINQNQVNGLISSIQDLQDQINGLDYFSTTGGTITGDVSLSGDFNLIGDLDVSGSSFRFDSSNGRFGINILSPSGSIHVSSVTEKPCVWIDGNPDGGSPSHYPSIKMLNSSSGVSTEIGVASPSLPVSSFDGGEFFINHGASLVSNETGNRNIKMLITGEQSFGINSSGAHLPSGKSLFFGGAEMGSFSFSVASGEQTVLDSVDGTSFSSAFYDISVQNQTGSRAEDYCLSWDSGVSSLFGTGSKSTDVGNTSGLQISGYKSGTSILLLAESSDTGWDIVGMSTYL